MTDAYDLLAPYVPRLVLDWLADTPDLRYRSVPGSLVFADISGFTALTERLSATGRAGAEEMADLLNAVFEDLLRAPYAVGAQLIKWGGDAVLLLFEGEEHAARAAQAAWDMQQVMARVGRLRTSRGVVRLGMSIGLHTGSLDALLVGERFRDLVVVGPATTAVCRAESQAARGQVLLTAEAARQLDPRWLGRALGDGVLLGRAPGLPPGEATPVRRRDIDPGIALPAVLRGHFGEGRAEHEHRSVAVGFLQFTGTDALEPEALLEAVTEVVDALQVAADDHGVALLASDLGQDGGKFMLSCGAPRSAGDHESRMLATLRQVVSRPWRLTVRAGATTGGVFAGDFGPAHRRTYSVAGDVVNLAARLMSRAGPGELFVTPEAVQRSRTAYVTRPLEPFAVKGKQRLVEAVSVGPPQPSAVRAEAVPLVGREAELAELQRLADDAGSGSGRAVELVGPPGIGKSRLVRELLLRSQAEVVWTEGAIFGQGRPFVPLRPLLQRAFGVRGAVPFTERGERLVRAVTAQAPDLVPWLPLLAAVVGVELPSTPEVDALDADSRRARLEQVLSDLLARLLPPRVALVLDDAFCADTATLGVLRRLAADAASRSWLVVVLQRPGAPLLTPAEHVTAMDLAPLEPAAAAELVRHATAQAPLPSHTARRVVERADGNPLFLLQLLDGAAAGADQLPDTLRSSVVAAVDRLPAPQRQLLRAASVFGMVVDPAWLDPVLARTGLAPADWAGLEEHVSTDADGRVHFRQHLVRQTAYEGLAFRTRVRLHAAAAEVIEAAAGPGAVELADVLLLHHAQGHRHDRTWQWGRIAGDRARGLYAPAEAARCYRQALLAAGRLAWLDDSEVADVQEALADSCLDLGEMVAAEQALRRARALSPRDPLRLAALCLRTARHRQHLGRHADALRWVRRGLRVLGEHPAGGGLRAELAERAALVHYDRGAHRVALTWADRCARQAEQAGEGLLAARGRSIAAVLRAMAGEPVGDADLVLSLAMFEEAGDLRGLARAHNAIGMRAYFAGDWTTAIDHYARAEQAWRRTGRDFDAAIDAVNRAEVLVQQGHVGPAEDLLAEAVPVLRGADATSFLGFAVTQWGRAALARGAIARAQELLAEARALCLSMGEEDEVLSLDALLAECHLRAGAPAEAMGCVQAIVGQDRNRAQASWAAPHLMRTAGEALLELGRPDEGTRWLRRALDVSRERSADYEVAASLEALLRCDVADQPGEAEAWSAQRAAIATALGLTLSR